MEVSLGPVCEKFSKVLNVVILYHVIFSNHICVINLKPELLSRHAGSLRSQIYIYFSNVTRLNELVVHDSLSPI